MVRAGVVKPSLDYSKAYTLQFVNKGVGLELRPKRYDHRASWPDDMPCRRPSHRLAAQASARPSPTASSALDAARSRRAAGRVRLAARAVRLRQVDGAADDRRAERADRAATSTWRDERPRRRARRTGDIGFVFQEPTLMPWATVAGNVHLPLKLAGIDAPRPRPRIARGAGAGRARRLRRRLSARAVRRHEDARLDRARAGDASRSCC